MPTRMNAEPASRYSVSFIAPYSLRPTPTFANRPPNGPWPGISIDEPHTPMSTYIGSTASS